MIISGHLKHRTFITITTSLALSIWALPAYAYLDPGTGSMLIQGIIGAIAALGVTLKLYWHKIKLMFRGSKTKDNSQDPSSGD